MIFDLPWPNRLLAVTEGRAARSAHLRAVGLRYENLERLLQEFGGLASRGIRYRDPSRDPRRGRGSAVTPANRERQGPAPLTACRLAPYQQAHWPGPPMATRGTMVAVPTGSGPSGGRVRKPSSTENAGHLC
ncbi:MAG TPA: hypothetical protein VE178_20040, partial [Silvibacterium sp.]|nr:hypothetical protein [Silvibacterium sp.]